MRGFTVSAWVLLYVSIVEDSTSTSTVKRSVKVAVNSWSFNQFSSPRFLCKSLLIHCCVSCLMQNESENKKLNNIYVHWIFQCCLNISKRFTEAEVNKYFCSVKDVCTRLVVYMLTWYHNNLALLSPPQLPLKTLIKNTLFSLTKNFSVALQKNNAKSKWNSKWERRMNN